MNNDIFFLGVNTPSGFYSLFNELYNPDTNDTIYLLKGGPGTGKSTIMKNISIIAESKGYYVERITCSSDPESLDAIIIPELNIAIADATAPHIINPVFPGISEHTVELGSCWDKKKLLQNGDTVKSLTVKNSAAHKKAVKYIKAVNIADKEIENMVSPIYDKEKIIRFIKRLNPAYFTEKGSIKRRFVSSLTPSGIKTHYGSVFSPEKDTIILKDKYGVCSDYIIRQLYNYASENNIKATVCLNPLNPSKLQHIIFDKLVIFTSDILHPVSDKEFKYINCNRFIDIHEHNKIKNKLFILTETKLELIHECIGCLKEAKAIHDILESYYIAAMNFDKVTEISENIINEIFL